MKTPLSLTIFSACILTSCMQNQTDYKFIKQATPTITYNQTVIPTLSLYDTLRTDLYQNEFDSVWFVKLEMTDNCIIGNMSDVHIYNNQIIIADTRSDGIYVFDFNGKLVRSIVKKGNGPCEYGAISTAHIKDSIIMVTDFISGKFLQYDIHGNCISERIDKRRSASYSWPFSDSLFLETSGYSKFNNNLFELTFTDEKQNVLGTARPFRTNIPIAASHIIKGDDDSLFYLGSLNDTLFTVNQNSLTPYLCLGLYSKDKLDKFYIDVFKIKKDNERVKFFNFKSQIPIHSHLTINSNYITIMFADDKYSYASIIDKKNLTPHTYIQMNRQTGVFYNIVGIHELYNDDWIVSPLSVSDINSLSPKVLEKSIEHLPNENLKNEIRNLAKLDSDSNGIIMFFHIKKR